MKIVPTFYIVVFLMIALTFGAPFVSYAQQVPEGAEETITSEQEMNAGFEKLVATATADAKQDVKVDFNNYQKLSWFSVGFGCSVLGVASAYLQKIQPPSTRLLAKPPDYVLIYGNTYQNELRKNRMVFAGSGCVVSLVLLAALISNDSSDDSLDVPLDMNTSSDDSLEDVCLGCLSVLDLVDFMASCLLNDTSCIGDSSGCLY